jgi:hypothetical protein
MLLAPGLPGALFFKLQKIQILKFQKNTPSGAKRMTGRMFIYIFAKNPLRFKFFSNRVPIQVKSKSRLSPAIAGRLRASAAIPRRTPPPATVLLLLISLSARLGAPPPRRLIRSTRSSAGGSQRRSSASSTLSGAPTPSSPRPIDQELRLLLASARPGDPPVGRR